MEILTVCLQGQVYLMIFVFQSTEYRVKTKKNILKI